MAGTYNILVEQGATWSETWTWKDAAGALVNLTGYTAKMDWRQPQSNALVLQLTTANGRIALGGVAGTIVPTASSLDTAALTPGLYDYDLFLTSPGGVTTRLLAGTVTVVAEVTQ